MPSASGHVVPRLVSDMAPSQLDALREVGNIGAGHAATALSEMTGRRVAIGVPTVSVAALGAIGEILGRGDVPLILARVRATGSFTGGLVIAFTEDAAGDLTDLLLGRKSRGTSWFDELGSSAIKEVGNVLGAAYVNALAAMTGWSIPISTPDLVYARADWAVSLLSLESQSDCGICFETSFRVEGTDAEVRGHVVLFPQLDVLESLLEAIGAEA